MFFQNMNDRNISAKLMSTYAPPKRPVIKLQFTTDKEFNGKLNCKHLCHDKYRTDIDWRNIPALPSDNEQSHKIRR